MATINPQRVETPLDGAGLQVFVWRDLHGGDVAGPHRTAAGAVTVAWVSSRGLAFGGATGLEGALDPDPGTAQYATLNDDQGNPLANVMSRRIEQVGERCYVVRPLVGAGLDGVDVWLLVRR